MKPCIQFLELIVDNPDKIFKDYIVREENRKLGKAPIRYYMQGEQISVDKFSEILDENLDDLSKKNDVPKKRIVRRIVKRIIKTKKEEIIDKKKKDIVKNQSLKTVDDDKLCNLFII